MHAPLDTPGAPFGRLGSLAPRSGPRLFTLWTVGALWLLMAPGASGQSTPPKNEAPPVLEAVVPQRITTRSEKPVGHLHLQGSFPEPSHRLLSRLAVWVSASNHSCRLGWSDDAITALLSASGQPWLVLADLVDPLENRSRHSCGTIDAVWDDRIEISIVHPRLLLPGGLRVGVALYPPPPVGLQPAATGQPAESWIHVPVVRAFRVVGRTPRAPVVRGNESLRITFAFTGDAPVQVSLGAGRSGVPLDFQVQGERVEVQVPPQHYSAPAVLDLRLSTGTETVQVSVPVCLGAVSAGVICPTP